MSERISEVEQSRYRKLINKELAPDAPLTDGEMDFLIEDELLLEVKESHYLLEDVVKRLRFLRRTFGSASMQQPPERTEPIRIRPSNPEQQRQSLVSGYLASLGANCKEAREFRRKIIAGIRPRATGTGKRVTSLPDGSIATSLDRTEGETVTLRADIAHSLLTDSDLWRLSPDVLEQLGISSLQSLNEIPSINDLQARWPEVTTRSKSIDLRQEPSDDLSKAVKIQTGPDPSEILDTAVNPVSILGELAEASEALAERLPLSAATCAWFILTGEPPHLPLIEARRVIEIEKKNLYSRGRIEFSVDLHASPRQLARHYSEIRRELGVDRMKLPTERAIAVFEFVNVERINNPHATWSYLVQAWDRSHPRWTYGGDFRTFRRAWDRARNAIFPKISN